MTDEWVPTRTPVEQVAWPDIAPTKSNRTASIWNTALKPTDPMYGINLWLTRVATGWTLNGSYGQAQKNRVFYPHNLTQQAVTIEGQMPNQYQYDRLVHFVKYHHQTALNDNAYYKLADTDNAAQSPCTFSLPAGLLQLPGSNLGAYRADAYYDGNTIVRRYYRAMLLDVYIVGIAAGHTRWNFAPTFTMDLMVSYDHLDEKVELAASMDKLLAQPGTTLVHDNAWVAKNYATQLNINGVKKVANTDNFSSDDDLLGPPVPLSVAIEGIADWNPS